jgi:hypothetical protein
MADTKDTIVAKFRRQFPECASDDGRVLFDEAYKFLLRRLGMRRTYVEINLTAGTPDYDLSDTVLTVEDVWYLTDVSENAQVGVQLEASRFDALVSQEAGWRYPETTGVPRRYAVQSRPDEVFNSKSVIRLDPAPAVTTASGVPVVRVFGTKYNAMLEGDDQIGEDWLDASPIVEEMKRRYARDYYPDQEGFYRTSRDQACEDQLDFVKGRQSLESSTTVLPAHLTRANVVV